MRPLSSIAAILVGLPAVTLASAPADYAVVRDWPPSSTRMAPGYGTAAVSAVAIDARGQIFVFQRAQPPVLVLDRDGKFLRAWGEGLFTNPHGCRIDPQGNLWVTDNGDHRVLKFTTEGKLLASLGVRNEPGEDATHFNKPTDVAFGPSGDVYVSDGYGNSRVVRFTREGRYLGAWGKKGTGEGEFNLPHSVAVDAKGRVYVADRENHRIQIFTREGKYVTQWRHVGHPFGLFLTRDQQLFVSDGSENTVSIYDLDGNRLARWGGTGHEPGQMDIAHLLCVDDHGAVYVAEINGKRLQKFAAR
jgi:DNA-binding beta-propeller fold protein YncE